MAPPHDRADSSFADLVASALDGRRDAWETLVDRLQNVAWHAISGFSLASEDRQDAFSATFFRLFERLHTIREPEKLPGWVATTARNEVHVLLRARRRQVPSELDDAAVPAVTVELDEDLVRDERTRALRLALARLPEQCRQLLHLLMVDPPMGYAEISEVLGIPHGSLGPTRQRCLARLRATPELSPFLSEANP